MSLAINSIFSLWFKVISQLESRIHFFNKSFNACCISKYRLPVLKDRHTKITNISPQGLRMVRAMYRYIPKLNIWNSCTGCIVNLDSEKLNVKTHFNKMFIECCLLRKFTIYIKQYFRWLKNSNCLKMLVYIFDKRNIIKGNTCTWYFFFFFASWHLD